MYALNLESIVVSVSKLKLMMTTISDVIDAMICNLMYALVEGVEA